MTRIRILFIRLMPVAAMVAFLLIEAAPQTPPVIHMSPTSNPPKGVEMKLIRKLAIRLLSVAALAVFLVLEAAPRLRG